MAERPAEYGLHDMDPCDAYALGVGRGYDVATARAESRRRLGLPIESEGCDCGICHAMRADMEQVRHQLFRALTGANDG